MDSSPSAPSPDVRESRPSFRKPANEVSRRNYRRHSPSSSRSPTPAFRGGWKRDRSPSCVSQDDKGSKKGRQLDSESEMRRVRTRKGTDADLHNYQSHSRDRYGRAEDYDHSYSRRHTSYHDRSHHNSMGRDSHARADYYRYDDGRYSKQSSERSVSERGRHRRKESWASERDRDKEDTSDVRASERGRDRVDKIDVRDHYRIKDREARSGQDKRGGKWTDEGSDVEVERYRHVKKMDNGMSNRDTDDDEGIDRDTNKVDGKERHKSKLDIERSKEKESRQRKREERKGKESEKDEDNHHKSSDRGHKERGEKHQKKYVHTPDVGKEDRYLSSGHEGAGEDSRERLRQGQDGSKKGDEKRKVSTEQTKSNHSSFEAPRGSQDATTAGILRPAVAASDHTDESWRLVSTMDEKSAKGTKWGPETEASDTATPSSNPEVAKTAAMKAAEHVNINLGDCKSVDQKKKMLWKSKNQEPAAVSGTNRWDTVQFVDRERQEKFNKLMSLSVLSFLSPAVGCQRGSGSRCTTKGGQHFWIVHNGEATRATTGFGKAIHCWLAKARWTDSGTWPIVCNCFHTFGKVMVDSKARVC